MLAPETHSPIDGVRKLTHASTTDQPGGTEQEVSGAELSRQLRRNAQRNTLVANVGTMIVQQNSCST